MTAPATEIPKRPPTGFLYGVRLGMPVVPGIMIFGLVVGAAAAREGLSFVENIAMNILVCSGVAQLVALEIWPHPLTFASIASLAVLTAVIGARLFLMSVAMRPWFGELPRWQAYAGLFFLTDTSWLIAMRYREEGGRDVSVYFGAAIGILAGWMVATCAGYLLGGLVVHPERFGLDLVLAVFFAAMLVPLWAGPRRACGWAIGGIVAITVQYFVPGWWFIVAGSVAGALAGGFLDEAQA